MHTLVNHLGLVMLWHFNFLTPLKWTVMNLLNNDNNNNNKVPHG